MMHMKLVMLVYVGNDDGVVMFYFLLGLPIINKYKVLAGSLAKKEKFYMQTFSIWDSSM